MAKLINLFGTFHNSTKRSYSERMNNEKIECIIKSKKYGFDYWDGERKFGYGGYKYIPGRLTALAKKIIKKYGAVSNECCLSMVKNLSKISKANISVSITGIAGPNGGTKLKPVGLIYIGCSSTL